MATNTVHPLSLLSATEIELATATLRAYMKDTEINFRKLDLQDAPKKELIPYLEAERLRKPLPTAPSRFVRTLIRRLDTLTFHVASIRLSPPEVVSVEDMPEHYQPPVDKAELRQVVSAILDDPTVNAEIKKLKLPDGFTISCDPWFSIIDEDTKVGGKRRFQGYMYANASSHPGSNHYSLPLSVSPILCGDTYKVIGITHLPLRDSFEGLPTEPWKEVKPVEHDPELVGMPMRTDIKPYIAQQPDGPSFTVDGNVVEWQKWRFRVGFHSREGLSLQNVTYDGRNPRAPYAFKQVFDAGDSGFGYNANQLHLGCDCLGHIHYFDGYTADWEGKPVHHRNMVCLHEQDGGLLHKMIATLGNYEYIFAYYFDQAAGIDIEVRATGILSTCPIDNHDGFSYPFGTNVGPGVFAPNHQHVFSLRVDPAIDG
ncbi:copper amine oxidase [Ilyonectria robusta]